MRHPALLPFTLVVSLALGLVLGMNVPALDTALSPVRGGTPKSLSLPEGTSSPSRSESESSGSAPGSAAGDGGKATSGNSGVPDVHPITKLRPGEIPPQFVVVSFDGAADNELWKHYLRLARATNSRFTFFLSGLYLLPERKRFLYKPPRKPGGTSAIGFGAASLIHQRIGNLAAAYESGHEIGTHFLGHFCDADGVGSWNRADWTSELNQARTFLDRWAEINGSTDPTVKLPFDSSVWRGGRTPCLAGKRDQLYPVLAKNGFTYDASTPGTLVWPRKIESHDLWSFPLQRINVVGYDKTNLSMDYNLLFVQNGGRIDAPPEKCAKIETSTYQSLMQALAAVESGNRAPFFVGNHFNTWACGAYRSALSRFVVDAHADYPGIRFVTNDYLVRWLDAQNPKVLMALQKKSAPSY